MGIMPLSTTSLDGCKISLMDESNVVDYITKTFPEAESTENFGYTMFFYRTDRTLSFATIISSDFEYDHISNLDRPGVFRLNIGVSRDTFKSLFGTAKVDISSYDFTTLDVIMPHPDYAKQYYVCVLSPSDATFERIKLMLAEAYEISARRFAKRTEDN